MISTKEKLVEYLNAGGTLLMTHVTRDDGTPSGRVYGTPQGDTVALRLAEEAISCGAVTPVRDGLLEDCSQTYVAGPPEMVAMLWRSRKKPGGDVAVDNPEAEVPA